MSGCIQIPKLFAQKGSWDVLTPKIGHLTLGTTPLGPEKGIDRFFHKSCLRRTHGI